MEEMLEEMSDVEVGEAVRVVEVRAMKLRGEVQEKRVRVEGMVEGAEKKVLQGEVVRMEAECEKMEEKTKQLKT